MLLGNGCFFQKDAKDYRCAGILSVLTLTSGFKSVYSLRIYAYHFLKISSNVNIQTRSLMLLKWRFTETCYDLEKNVAAKL